MLEGGIAAWAAEGHVLFSGVNVPSKAFGEVVEHELGTPSISTEELRAMLDAGEDLVVLDSRPTPEFTNCSIPGGTCCPGAELAYRVHDAAPSPDTTVVVNCAGRTRSIIGAQAIINAGVPNRVMSLRNGTMAWHLAGFDLAKGTTEHAAKPSAKGLAKARAAAARVDAPVRVLEGGNAAWVATGYSLTTTEPRFLDDDIDDVLVRIHEAEGGMEKAMNDYLEWEIGLVGDVVLDGAAAWQRMEEGGGR